MTNKVYIATSLDGYIADRNGGLDWLPAPSGDFGFEEFIDSVDALVMGRNTFEMVLKITNEWFYKKKVFVVSSSLKEIPKELEGKVELLDLTPKEIVSLLNEKGYHDLYIDGGKTIQGFLKDDLIDEMIITTIPILLGGGSSLFGELEEPVSFKCIETKLLAGTFVQSYFIKED